MTPGAPMTTKATRQPSTLLQSVMLTAQSQPRPSKMFCTAGAVEVLRDGPAEIVRQRAADGDAHGEDGERVGAALGLEIIADDRVGGRRAAGLADGDADARDQEEEEGRWQSRTVAAMIDQTEMHSAMMMTRL